MESAKHADAIRKILQAQQNTSVDDGSGDVVFAMFLEPHDVDEAGMFDSVVNYVVQHFQPTPVLVHCELVVPSGPEKKPTNFATYFGCRSGWQIDEQNNKHYYLGATANKWRAVPVFGKNAARLVREACEKSKNVEYSLFRYLTAAWGVRALAGLVPDGFRRPAHCATLTSRVLKAALGKGILHRPSAFYGPSSLYKELCKDLESQSILPNSSHVGVDVATYVDCLLRHEDSEVSRLSHDNSMKAIRALTLKASAAQSCNDPVMAVLTQKQLANALFRWSILRK